MDWFLSDRDFRHERVNEWGLPQKRQAIQLKHFQSRHLHVQSKQEKNEKNVWNMFEINNKDTRTTSAYVVKFEYFLNFF